jgi:GNAT superfamily N-acetyltransferase
VTAQVDGQLVGFAFGYDLRPDSTWWEGLTPVPSADFTSETGDRTVVLAEIEVSRAWQGRGIGHRLHDAFLSDRAEERATLATGPRADEARRRYEGWGWRQLGTVPGASGDYFDAYILYIRSLPLNV